MTVAELESRVTELEKKLVDLQQQLEHDRMIAGIKRGLDAADRGECRPLREVDAELRAKYNIPRQ